MCAYKDILSTFNGAHCCFTSLFHWTGTGWCENSTRWKSCRHVRARGRGAWTCLAHASQCLCDGQHAPTPCPATRNLLVLEVSPAPSPCCFNSLFHLELVRVGVKIPQDGNHANVHRQVVVVRVHVWRTLCSVCATGARVAHPVPCNS
jgi:hypothetical protein